VGLDLFAPDGRDHVDRASDSSNTVYEARMLGSDGTRLSVTVRCAVFRDADVVARLGGDEFAVLASDCREADIEVIGACMQAGVDRYNASSGEAFRL
jgi:predicted signal transduction protein with EAL and GGDEF domain